MGRKIVPAGKVGPVDPSPNSLYVDTDFADEDFSPPPKSYWDLSKVASTPWMRKLPMLALCLMASCMESFKGCWSIFMVDRATWKMYRMSLENAMGFVWETIIVNWWPKWTIQVTGGQRRWWRFQSKFDNATKRKLEKLEVYKQRGGTIAEREHANNLLERTMLRAENRDAGHERDKMLIMYAHKMHTIRFLQLWAEKIRGDTMESSLKIEFADIERARNDMEFIKRRMACLDSQLGFSDGPRCFDENHEIVDTKKRVEHALGIYERACKRAILEGPPLTPESLIFINSMFDFPFNSEEKRFLRSDFTSRSHGGDDLRDWMELRVDSVMRQYLFPEETKTPRPPALEMKTKDSTESYRPSNGEIVAEYLSRRFNLNLKFLDVGGKGECLYNALAVLFGETSEHWRLLLTGRLDFGVWGTHVEIITMATNMKCAIQVHAIDAETMTYDDDLSQRFTPAIYGDIEDANLKTVHLINWVTVGEQHPEGFHFDPLVETPSVISDYFGEEFFYYDMNDVRQGPFPSENIERWFEEGYMDSDMSLWRSSDGSEVKVSIVMIGCLFFYLDTEGNRRGPVTKEHIKKWYVEGYMQSDTPLFVAIGPPCETTVHKVLANKKVLLWDWYTDPSTSAIWWWCEETQHAIFNDPAQLRMQAWVEMIRKTNRKTSDPKTAPKTTPKTAPKTAPFGDWQSEKPPPTGPEPMGKPTRPPPRPPVAKEPEPVEVPANDWYKKLYKASPKIAGMGNILSRNKYVEQQLLRRDFVQVNGQWVGGTVFTEDRPGQVDRLIEQFEAEWDDAYDNKTFQPFGGSGNSLQ